MMEFHYIFDEEVLLGLTSALVTGIPSGLLGIVSYILTALALYTMAQRRGLKKAWLAWIPVVNCWILGSLSDQYRYVVRGENRSKRKSLLVLSLINLVLGLMVSVLAIVMLVQVISGFMNSIPEGLMLEMIMGPGVSLLGLCLPMAGVSIAFVIIRYMALYDVYKSMEPGNAVLFLVLSILAGIVEPFFLFFNRDKDLGMPPRRTAQQDIPEEPIPEPWEAEDFENKDYL